MEFLELSDSSGKQHEYKQLDSFVPSSEKPSVQAETDSENTGETDSENEQLTDEDAAALTGMGIEQISKYLEENIDAPIVISDAHKEEITKKGAVLVKKYLPSGDMPPWLLAWKVEIEFGLAVGACAFSIYKQKLAHDKSILEAEQVASNGD